jgi:hypothetical protein
MEAGFATERLAIQRGLGLGGGFGQWIQEKPLRFFALATSGFEQAAQGAVVLETFSGAGALDDFARDHHGPQTGFG